MARSIRSGRRSVAMLALALAFASVAVVPAAVPAAAAAEYKVVVKKSGFRSVRLHGSSPWICTPSGFGQKARCYARGSA